MLAAGSRDCSDGAEQASDVLSGYILSILKLTGGNDRIACLPPERQLSSFGLSTRLVVNEARRSIGPGRLAGSATRGRKNNPKIGPTLATFIQNASNGFLSEIHVREGASWGII